MRKKRNLLWLMLILWSIACVHVSAWNQDGSILDYSPKTDTVGEIPQNAGGAAADTSYTDRFTAYSREGGTGVSNISVYDDAGDKLIRFYSTEQYTSGNLNVYLSKKADLSAGPIAVSTRIKGYNSTNGSAAYAGQRMFPQITLRSATTSTKQAIFTMYNGQVAAGDVGAAGISGLKYENEWHDVLLVITRTEGNAISIDYYYDREKVNTADFTLNSNINPADLLITFGGHFRSGNAQCFYDYIQVYRQTAQEFSLKKSEHVSLNESLSLSFKNQLDPQSLRAENVQITAEDGTEAVVSEIVPNAAMDTLEVRTSETFREKTTYTVTVRGLVDVFGQECAMSATFVTGEAALSIENLSLKAGSVSLNNLQEGALTVCATANNQTKQEQGVTLAAALYKGSAMTKLFVSPYQALAPGETAALSLDLQIETLRDGDYSLQVFCVNDLLRLNALQKAVVFTETETGASADGSKQAVVKVNANHAAEGELVTLAVLDKNKTFAMLDPAKPKTAEDAIVYLGQTETNADGACEFRFDFPHEMGEYTYRAADAYGIVAEDSFFFYTQEDEEKTITALNTAETDDFAALMAKSEVQKLLGVDTAVFDKMETTAQAGVIAAMYRERSRDVQTHTAEQFAAMFSRAVFLAEVSAAPNAETVEQLMDTYGASLAMREVKLYALFSKNLSPALQKEVYGALAGEQFAEIYDFYDRMDLYTVTKTLPKVSTWQVAENILKQADAVMKLGLNLTDYNGLKDPSAVDLTMMRATLTDWKSVTETFNTAVSDCKRKENTPPDYGGGISGGGNTGGIISGGGGIGGGGGSSGGAGQNAIGALSLLDQNLYPVEELEPIREPQTENAVFEDLDSVEWARESILYLKEQGIVNGRDVGRFEPEADITREEFIAILASALRFYNEYAVCSFEDMQKDAWYYPYVASAYEIGIVNGIDGRAFGIGVPITRQDAAVMSSRALAFIEVSLKDTADAAAFRDDAEISAYAKDAVYAMNRAGVLNGYEDATFKPEGNITRAETACVVYRVLQAIETAYTIE